MAILGFALLTLGGTAWAASAINGKLIRARSVPGNRIQVNSVGPMEVNEARLGKVRSAARADLASAATTASSAETAARATTAARADVATSATTAGSATTATTAENANALGGQPAASYLQAGTFVERHPGTEWNLQSANVSAMQLTAISRTTAASAITTTHWYPVSAPMGVAGRSTRLESIRYCLGDTTNAYVVYARIDVMGFDPNNPLRSTTDETDRDGDQTCYVIAPDAPIELGPNETIDLALRVFYSAAGARIDLGLVEATWRMT